MIICFERGIQKLFDNDIIFHMKILGIDPGMAIVGYGIIDINEDKMELITSGSIQTDKKLSYSKMLL